jgi:hypothetical protein
MRYGTWRKIGITTGIATALLQSAVFLDARQSTLPGANRGHWGSTTSVISPVVVASWFTDRTDGFEELELLVLWRGSPGWFQRPGGAGGTSDGLNGPFYDWLKYGDVTLSVEYDPQHHTARIQDTPLSVANNNVVFVDDVDAPSGARVAGMTAVPRLMPGSAGQIGLVLRNSPTIMSFLRCDTPTSSPRLRGLCLQNVGVAR